MIPNREKEKRNRRYTYLHTYRTKREKKREKKNSLENSLRETCAYYYNLPLCVYIYIYRTKTVTRD